MVDFKLKKQLHIIGGIFAVSLYCAFTFSSIPFYPPPFSPLTNWLSDLGNPIKNPEGAILYNLGCILSGVALIPFFYGLDIYKEDFNRKWQRTVVVCQVVGFVTAFAFIGVGSFPGDVSAYSNIDMHMFFSNSVFYTIMILLIILGIMLIKHPRTNVWIGIYNFIVAGINMMFLFTSIASELFEWMTVFTALGFVALIVINTAKNIKKAVKLI